MRTEAGGLPLTALAFVGKMQRTRALLFATTSGKNFSAPGGAQEHEPADTDHSDTVAFNMMSIGAISKFIRTKRRMETMALEELGRLEEEHLEDLKQSMAASVSVGAGLAQLRFLGRVSYARNVRNAQAANRPGKATPKKRSKSGIEAAELTQLRSLGALVKAHKESSSGQEIARPEEATSFGAGMKQLKFLSRLKGEVAKSRGKDEEPTEADGEPTGGISLTPLRFVGKLRVRRWQAAVYQLM
jgi:microcompartment protein CcmK/EutM